MQIKNVVIIGSGTMGCGIAAQLCNAKIPVTLFHGTKDEAIPVKFSRKLIKIFTKAKRKLIIIKNGDHSLFSKKYQKKILKELENMIKDSV